MTDNPAKRVALTRLKLANFRNHAALDISSGGLSVALTGPNGAGKTNILEALSMLAPGRGLRRAARTDMARQAGDGSWAVAAELEGAAGPAQLGTGTDSGDDSGGRRFRINGANACGPGSFAEHLRFVWLTPSMDGLFGGPAGDRRRFLDRLVLAADPDHGSRVAGFERALRTRNRLLEDHATDPRWLDAVEREIAELAIAVAAARFETVQRLSAMIAETRDDAGAFPHAEIALGGWMETEIASGSALAAEDTYRARLRSLRARDRAAGRTTEGPQASDLSVRHGPKAMPAALCSTGEQKALLIGLVLAHAGLVARLQGAAPLVLLDEVAAHLDPARRQALYDTLDALGAQAWLTGADPAAFVELGERAALFRIGPGHAEQVR
ncbi:DNA replication/repair protein RecF [Terrihabitans sp. B22-R8]|uniref:DNA replication/repair protein RecF n=1 Tax=Terrihabitans sp. B22-R8 TaxID=3425128 RepID=UPI00403CD37D